MDSPLEAPQFSKRYGSMTCPGTHHMSSRLQPSPSCLNRQLHQTFFTVRMFSVSDYWDSTPLSAFPVRILVCKGLGLFDGCRGQKEQNQTDTGQEVAGRSLENAGCGTKQVSRVQVGPQDWLTPAADTKQLQDPLVLFPCVVFLNAKLREHKSPGAPHPHQESSFLEQR